MSYTTANLLPGLTGRLTWALFLVLATSANAQRSPAQRASPRPTWVLDSATDRMTDEKVIRGQLNAVAAISSKWGTFVPSLAFICFTDSHIRENINGISLRLKTGVSPNLSSVSSGLEQTDVVLRFDTAPPAYLTFTVNHTGNSHYMEPFEATENFMGKGKSFASGNEVRDSVLGHLLASERMLAQFTLISDETVVAEFRFDSSTRPTFTHVMSACGMDIAKYAP